MVKLVELVTDGVEDGDAVTKGQLDKAIKDNAKLVVTDSNGEKVEKLRNGKYYREKDIKNGKLTRASEEVTETKVSLSHNNKPTKLGNVAAGRDKHDAVNVAQLEQVRSEVYQNLGTVADGVNNNSRRLDRLEKSHRRGVANAIATAGVKFQHIEKNEFSIGAAVGYYEDQGAVAIGIQGAPSENLRVHGTISASPGRDPESAVSLGFSLKFKVR